MGRALRGVEEYKQRTLEGIFQENVILGENQYLQDKQRCISDGSPETQAKSITYVIPRLLNATYVSERSVAEYGRSVGYLRKLSKESPEQLVISEGLTTTNIGLLRELLKLEALILIEVKLESGGGIRQILEDLSEKMDKEVIPKYGKDRRSRSTVDNYQRLIKDLSKQTNNNSAEPNNRMHLVGRS